jgi:hypothetical protein
MGKELAYNTEEFTGEENKHKYFFESVNTTSEGKVFKAIEYSFIQQEYQGKKIYNLGFGDYDAEKNEIIDDVLTNNGDHYKVFNTVLNSVPLFFEKFPESCLFVSGSDSKDEFADECRKACRRACTVQCKKQHRRIKAYCEYINKNYDELSQNYDFLGGVVTCKVTNSTSVSKFEPNVKYDVVLVFKKN